MPASTLTHAAPRSTSTMPPPTPVIRASRARWPKCLAGDGIFGNAASVTHAHGAGRAALVEAARAEVAALVGAQAARHRVHLRRHRSRTTSPSSASCAAARASRVPPSSSRRAPSTSPCSIPCGAGAEGVAITLLEPGSTTACFDPAALAARDPPRHALVSLMHVNNETGVAQDLAALGAVCRARGVPLHVRRRAERGQAAARRGGARSTCCRSRRTSSTGRRASARCTSRRRRGRGCSRCCLAAARNAACARARWPLHQIAGLRRWPAARARRVGVGGAARQRVARAAVASAWRACRRAAERRSGTRLPGHPECQLRRAWRARACSLALPELALSTGSACNSAAANRPMCCGRWAASAELAQSSLRFSLGRFSDGPEIERAAMAIREQCGGCGHSRHESAASRGSALAARPAVFRSNPRCRSAGRPRPSGALVWRQGAAGAPLGGPRVVVHVALRFGDAGAGAPLAGLGLPAHACDPGLVVGAVAWADAGRSARGGPAGWARALDVPVEKLGRMLIIEDAVLACLKREPVVAGTAGAS